ncbi:helix-turn-helix transcriptional regulator [Shewanella algae]|uniref:helix-turn-helix domain-containing protein n=1 Tax=Shewanella TaxID=22 RepID=UPI003005D088
MIHRALKVIRQYHDLPLAQLASELEIPKQQLQKLESGEKPIDTATLEKYSLRFDIPKSSLVMFSSHINNEKRVSKKFREIAAGTILDISEWVLSKNAKAQD